MINEKGEKLWKGYGYRGREANIIVCLRHNGHKTHEHRNTKENNVQLEAKSTILFATKKTPNNSF